MDRLRIAGKVVRKHWDTFARWTIGIASLWVGIRHIREDHGAWKVFALGAGAFFIGWSLRKFARDWSAIEETIQARPVWGYTATYASWRPLGDGRTHAIYSPELNRRLASDDPIVLEHGSTWFPSGRADELRERVLVRLALNEPKLRLATDLLENSSTVVLDDTDYASFIATNRLAYAAWWHRHKEEMYLTFEDLEPSSKVAKTLPDLQDSSASNHLGGDLLAVGDGFFFLQLQSNKGAMYPDLWVGSASGSFDKDDWPSSQSLQDLVKAALLRELKEEMRLRDAEVPAMSDTRIIGFARATYLGGKPQFYGITKIGDVTPRPDKYAKRFLKVAFEGGPGGLVDALDGFVKKHDDRISPPLEMLSVAVRDWIQDPDAAGWLFEPVP